jgi:type III pantothenate kinase
MHLTLDFGNSATKAGIFSGTGLVHVQTKVRFSNADLSGLLKKFPIDCGISSSVTNSSVNAVKFLSSKIPFMAMKATMLLPIRNFYKTRSTLGTDRLAALIGARSFFPKANVLVISAGTCITYDVINAKGAYYGGNITPGLQMRLRSMHTFTARLPLVKKKVTFDLFGSTTRDSMLTGALTGATLEMSGFIQSYRRRYKNLRVIITGGDAPFFIHRLSSGRLQKEYKIFALPHLVLYGLNEILLATNASDT